MFKTPFMFFFALIAGLVLPSHYAKAEDNLNIYNPKYLVPVYSGGFDAGTWSNIGCQRADYINDRYVMDVDQDKGRFDKLRLKISSKDFHVIGLQVVLRNGERKRLVVKSEDSYPGRGVILRLPGRGQYLKKIILHYGSRSSSYQPIVVCIDGHEAGYDGGGYGSGSSSNDDYGSGSDNYGSGSHSGGYSDNDDYGSAPVVPRPSGQKWTNLGCVKAKWKWKNRYFRVGRSKGRFKALRFKAGKHAIRLKHVSVTYGNGRKKTISISGFLGRRLTSERVNLGAGRFVKVVDVRVKTKILFSKSGFCLEGLQKGRSSGGYNDDEVSSRWKTLGCKSFSHINARSRFLRLGRHKGRFKSLRLKVSGTDLRLHNLGVVYGNGRDETLQRRSIRIRSGGRSSVFTLSGGRRYIKELEIVAAQRRRSSTPATVCVQGRQ